MKPCGHINVSALHKYWAWMPAELMSSLGKLHFHIYGLLDGAAEWLRLWADDKHSPSEAAAQLRCKDTKMERTQKVAFCSRQRKGGSRLDDKYQTLAGRKIRAQKSSLNPGFDCNKYFFF